MTWRFVVGLIFSSVPAVSLTPWATTKGVEARELRFTDKSGEHVVRFSLSREQKREEGEVTLRSRELTVTHLVGKKEVFKARDFVQRCEFDLALEVLEDAIRLTDLDDDGEPEVSFIYTLGCRSDVSPLTAKLLLYEGSTKYALRGETREQVGEAEFVGGEFKADPAFEQGPRPFFEFAEQQWRRQVVEVRGR